MKNLAALVIGAALALICLQARAGLFNFEVDGIQQPGSPANLNISPNPIPQGNPGGAFDQQSVSFTVPAGASVSQVIVSLDISGGFNGDLYAALTHNNASSILLSRVG